MEDTGILTISTIVAAFVGALFGSGLERLLRRAESIPLFRIQLGIFEDVGGWGVSISVENIGLEPLPPYALSLFHPERGSLLVFQPNGEDYFPQFTSQINKYRCLTRHRDSTKKVDYYYWFTKVGNNNVSAPHFSEFEFRITLQRSERVLMSSIEMGNTLAKWMYQDISGGVVEQPVQEVVYQSDAPFWVEYLRRCRIRRNFARVFREK